MEFSGFFWATMLWMVGWGVIGSIALKRRYLHRDLDTSNTSLVGAFSGAAAGPVVLVPLWLKTPQLTTRHIVLPMIATVVVFGLFFAMGDPGNICVTNGTFVASQIVNGLVIGIIYGFMALGLTLIFSILGIVSFAHGEFYMIGGMITYFITSVWLPGINPIIGVLGAMIATFALGAGFERMFLTPMYTGKIDRPVEYGILVTFGLAFTLQYFCPGNRRGKPGQGPTLLELPAVGASLIRRSLAHENQPWVAGIV